MLERVLRPWHSRQVLDARGKTRSQLCSEVTSALATFSYCFHNSNIYVLTDLNHDLSFKTLNPTHFYEVHRHMHIFYYYALLFTGSFASIVKAVTARALNHICGCEAASLATRGNSRCTPGASTQLHSWHVPLADEIAFGQLHSSNYRRPVVLRFPEKQAKLSRLGKKHDPHLLPGKTSWCVNSSKLKVVQYSSYVHKSMKHTGARPEIAMRKVITKLK